MHYFKHVGGTWLLANALHPFIFCCLMQFSYGNTEDLLFIFVASLVCGFLLSLPLLILCSLVLPQIVFLSLPAFFRYILWCIVVCSLLLVYCCLVHGFYTDWQFDGEMLLLSLPALFVTLFAVLFRMQAFEKMCALHKS